jgi:hypothetical protein
LNGRAGGIGEWRIAWVVHDETPHDSPSGGLRHSHAIIWSQTQQLWKPRPLPPMRTFTLDSSCIDAINEGRAEVKFIRSLADAYTAGKAKVAVVALSTAEKQQFGSYFDDFDSFRDHLAALDLLRLEILKPMAYFDISFSDWCIEPDETMQALEKKIHDILFPQSEFTWEDYCEEHGIDPDFSPRGDWRKRKCNVQSLWAHVQNKRDVFVTIDDSFQKPATKSALIGLGAGHIEHPQQAVAMI